MVGSGLGVLTSALLNTACLLGNPSSPGFPSAINPVFDVGETVAFNYATDALGVYNSLPGKTVITEFQPSHGWNTNSGGSHNYNSQADPIIGTQHFQLTTNGSQGYKYCQDVPLAQAFDFSGKNLAVLMKIDGVDRLDEFQIILGSATSFAAETWRRYGNLEGSQGVKWFSDGEWTLFVMPMNTEHTSAALFDETSVRSIRIAFRDDASSALTVDVQAVATYAPPASPSASIIFDDAHESVQSLAAPVLQGHNIKASIAAPHDVLGTGSYMSVEELQALQNTHGWEIVGHATGNDQTADTQAQVVAYLAASKAFWTANNLFVYGWVYSGGEYGAVSDNANIRVRDLVETAGFKWARTVHEKIPASLPASDPFKLPTIYITNVDTPASVIANIDAALAAGMWPILVFHRIVAGAATQTTEYPVADFTTIINHLATQNISVQVPSRVIRG